MDYKTFNASLGLLATALGIKPEDVIGWFQEMSQHYTSDHSPVAEYLSMVLAPFKPQLFILADNKRKTLVIGGPGTPPKHQNFKVEFAPELTTIGKWFHDFRPFISDEIVIPKTVVSIEADALELMDFKRLRIESRILELPWCVCCNCHELTVVHLPDTLEKIGFSAFRFCRSLSEINIPDSLQIIEESAFEGCDALPDDTRAKILEIGGPKVFGKEKENR